ncbi:MAG: nucleotidyltransferase family protein [Anaerolineae bacterium]|nr:nucleotidyltransferase family protein [Anaerolineae bacterium]
MTQSENTFSLLALCARAQGHPTQYQQLRQQAATLILWNSLPAQAESHGLAPLVYAHLQAAGVAMPADVQQQLQARAMQHSHANRVRAKALAEVLAAFQSAKIDALALKGAALAQLVYPQPGLRPMRDVDLLVSKLQTRQAQSLLVELGFNAPLPGDDLPAKHLPNAQRETEGLPVSIELHHNLYTGGAPAAEFEALCQRAIPFTVEGVTAYTLGHEDMLEHIYQHLRVNLLLDSLRLIWVADLVSLAEGYAGEIDWQRVSPRLRHALALCHWLTPLSEALRQTAPLKLGRPPQGIGANVGLEFQGWPRYSLAARRHKGYAAILRDTFFPAEWWLRFYYGLPSAPSPKFRIDPAWWWGRWARHPLHILGWVRHYFRHRAKI